MAMIPDSVKQAVASKIVDDPKAISKKASFQFTRLGVIFNGIIAVVGATGLASPWFSYLALKWGVLLTIVVGLCALGSYYIKQKVREEAYDPNDPSNGGG